MALLSLLSLSYLASLSYRSFFLYRSSFPYRSFLLSLASVCPPRLRTAFGGPLPARVAGLRALWSRIKPAAVLQRAARCIRPPLRRVAALLALTGLLLMAVTGCSRGLDQVAEARAVPLAATGTRSIAGRVLDGPIAGAVVFLDLNGDLEHDPDEPRAEPTDEDGRFTLALGGLEPANLVGTTLVANIPATARDRDDGGKTLAEAGRPAFVVLSPAQAWAALVGDEAAAYGASPVVSEVILSPFTTIVSARMRFDGLTLSDAHAQTRALLGASVPDPLADFVERGHAPARVMARTLATSMGQAVQHYSKRDPNSTYHASPGMVLHYALDQFMAQLPVTVGKSSGRAALPATGPDRRHAGGATGRVMPEAVAWTALDWTAAAPRRAVP